MLVYTKSEGEYVEHDWNKTELKDWFKSNIDEEGNVQDEIVLFANSEIKAASEGYDWVLSDYTLDRDGERVDPAGWDLKAFKKNPVVQWAHDHKIPAIGKVTGPRVKDGELTGKITFDSDNDDFARMIEGKVKGGIINTGSVGFRSIAVELTEDKAKEDAWLIHRKQELMEFSLCNVPSNPAAMRRDAEPEEEKDDTEIDIEVKLDMLLDRIETLENERNIYKDIFKDRDETSPDEEDETSPLDDLFNIPDKITIKELLNERD